MTREYMIRDIWMAKIFAEDDVPLEDQETMSAYFGSQRDNFMFVNNVGIPALKRACVERGCTITKAASLCAHLLHGFHTLWASEIMCGWEYRRLEG